MGRLCELPQLVHLELVNRLLSGLLCKLHMQNTYDSRSSNQKDYEKKYCLWEGSFSPTVFRPGRLEFWILFQQASRSLIVVLDWITVVAARIVVVVCNLSPILRIIIVRRRILSLFPVIQSIVVGDGNLFLLVVWQKRLPEDGVALDCVALQSCKKMSADTFGLGMVLSKVDKF